MDVIAPETREIEQWFKFDTVLYDELLMTDYPKSRWDSLLHASTIRFIEDNDSALVFFEYILNALTLCIDHDFSFEQALEFVDASMILVHDITVKSKELTADDAVSKFNTLMQMHSEIRGSKGPLFSADHIKKIANFVSDTLIRNIKAYQYVFHMEQAQKIESIQIEVQTPLIPMSLDSGKLPSDASTEPTADIEAPTDDTEGKESKE
jgi:hypothetical protein